MQAATPLFSQRMHTCVQRGIVLLLAGAMFSSLQSVAQPPLRNQLAGHSSPYLALHQQDPVHWQLWNQATIDKAKELKRPILVSIGYFACHWCHVMQRESYRDPQLAALLNDAFIPVKVDRELEPALDAHLMEFVELTRGQAGWPLNVFLTPEGYPIIGVTYLPKDSFRALLESLQQRWSSDPGQLAALAENALKEWQAMRGATKKSPSTTASFVEGFTRHTDRAKDELAGGFGQQSKFPMTSQLRALLWLRAHRSEKSFDEFLHLTLDRMAGQGLHDLLGGGFFRYVTDPDWQTPHFEKMLYDNAQLALLYLEAAAQFESGYYREIGLGTLDFMIREMRAQQGYFISSFSAVDEQGREGFYYLWDDATLEALLDARELKAATLAWFDAGAAASGQGQLPRREMNESEVAAKLQWRPATVRNLLASARDKLLAAREKRSLPEDNKGLAAWNGLALSALAAGYASRPDRRYAAVGDQLASWLATRLWDGKRVARALAGNGQPLGEASLEDYALVAQGLWAWSEQRPQAEYQAIAESLVRAAWQRYFTQGRWLQSEKALIPMLDGRIAFEDSSLPSASAIIADLSSSIPRLQQDAAIQQKLKDHLEQVQSYLVDSAFWYAGYIRLQGRTQALR